MPMAPGLNPNIRQAAPEGGFSVDPEDIFVQLAEDAPADKNETNDNGEIISIHHDDGSVTVSIDGSSLGLLDERKKKLKWFDNLVDEIPDAQLNLIAGDLLRLVEVDLQSRKQWTEDRAIGLKLLGLSIEVPGVNGASEGAPVEGMSRVRHPLLQEAVLRFQANARSELLPTDGPVKIRNDNNNAQLGEDQLADALEKDLNHYLTSVATEYYPDTDRMLLMLGLSGTAFKKVYYCPLRNRPLSESVDADDLIVNNSATDLASARRITHRSFMRPSTVRRMQLLGAYRDIDLSAAKQPNLDSLQREKKQQQGVTDQSYNPEDRDREIYECYCELDINGFEHKYKGKESGLEIPYRVTIDVSSKQILSIVRNYDEDEELPIARANFVHYIFVPGFGFYGIGLLHILGNTTNALTAAWREMLDAGMYANFPGFLMADTGARQNTNIFRVPPGGGALVKTGGMKIGDSIMPLPYKDVGPGLIQLVESMVQTGMRLGGTSEQQVGEGRADAPVGTTLAMIEQATKVMNAVHKRMHAAQAEEFQLLARCFKENPESFWQRIKKPSYQWDEETFLKALNDCELIPQADPNTASHAQRVMKIMALKQLQAANQSMYDPIAIDTAALQAIGWSNPQQFFAPPSAQGQPPPQMVEAEAKLKIQQQDADSKSLLAKSKAQEIAAKVQGLAAGDQSHNGAAPQEFDFKNRELDFEKHKANIEAQNQDKDRQTELAVERARLVMEQMRMGKQHQHERQLKAADIAADHLSDMHAAIMKQQEPKNDKG